MTNTEAGYDAQDDDRSFVPGFADPDTEEMQQRRGTGSFDVALSGYKRSQVDSYLAQVRWTIDELRGELAAAQEQARSATLEAQRMRKELERGRPDADVIGGRIGKIIALAEAEAEQIRAEADRQVKGVDAERKRIIDDAQAHAESLVADARRHAAQVTEEARRNAAKVTEDAGRSAAQTTEAARRDLELLTRQRSAVVAELQRAHEHLGQVVAQATGARGPQQPPAPEQPTVQLSPGAEDRSVIQLPTR